MWARTNCVCSFGWCEEASKLAAENGLEQFKGSIGIPQPQGGNEKVFGPVKEAMRDFVRDRWLTHIKHNGDSLVKKPCIRRVHFSNDALALARDGRTIGRLFKIGRHSSVRADIYLRDNACETLMVLPNMSKAEAMKQVSQKPPTAAEIHIQAEETAYQHALSGIGTAHLGPERAMLAKLVDTAPLNFKVSVKKLLRTHASEQELHEQNLEKVRQEQREEVLKQHHDAITGEKRKREIVEASAVKNLADASNKLIHSERERILMARAAVTGEKRLRETLEKRPHETAEASAARKMRDASDKLLNSERQTMDRATAAMAKRKDRDLKEAMDDIKRWKARCVKLQSELNTEVAKAAVYTPTGLSLSNLVSEQWHAKNKGAANVYFGHKTLEEHMEEIHLLLPDREVFAEIYEAIDNATEAGDSVALNSAENKLEKRKKHKMQAASLCVLKLRMGWQAIVLQNISGWGNSKVSLIINKWTPMIEAAKDLRS